MIYDFPSLKETMNIVLFLFLLISVMIASDADKARISRCRIVKYSKTFILFFHCRCSKRTLHLLAPIPVSIRRKLLQDEILSLGRVDIYFIDVSSSYSQFISQRLVRLCADDPVVLAGALPGHLHPALHLPHVRHQEGRHRLLPLLDQRPPRLRPAPRLHQDQLCRPPVSVGKLHL